MAKPIPGWQASNKSASKDELDLAWRDRLADAHALLAQDRAAGAIAAGLYALEIRLKVAVCERLDLESLPPVVQFHDLHALLVLAGLSRRLDDLT